MIPPPSAHPDRSPPSLPRAEHPASSDGEGLEPRVLRPRRAGPADAVRPTRAEINLANLRHNLRVATRIAEQDSSRRAAVWGVLKADAYGHGAPAVARTLERAGIPGLSVALLEEALELRAAGIRIPILVMGGYYGPQRQGLDEIVEHDLTPVIYDRGQIERLAHIAAERQRLIRVHVKFDTGMSRLGASPDDADDLLEALAAARGSKNRGVRLDGLMTHLACADAPDPQVTLDQLRAFERLRVRAVERGLAPAVCHAANSAALFGIPASRLDAVRPGVALFGVAPREPGAPIGSLEGPLAELRPVMKVQSEIVALRDLRPGDAIGYGHTHRVERLSRIATIPIGYADGLSRQLSNKGNMLIRGRRVPIVGAVSMDLTTVDVTDVPGVRLGDEAVVLGSQEGVLGSDTITADEIAGHMGTISWEVLTAVSRRVPRFYREP